MQEGSYKETNPKDKKFSPWFKEFIDTPQTKKEQLEVDDLLNESKILTQEIFDTEMDEEIENISDEMKERGETYQVMRNILERGRKETHFFDDIIGTDVYSTLLEADIGSSKVDGKRVSWGGNEEKKGSGGYNKIIGVYVGGNIPSFDRVIRDLATSGQLPETLKTLHHELIHGQQEISIRDSIKKTVLDSKTDSQKFSKRIKTEFEKLKRDFSLLQQNDFKQILKNAEKDFLELVKSSLPQTELLEAQAYRVADFQIDQNYEEDIVNHVVEVERNGKKVYKVDRDKMSYAVYAIDTLVALGFSNDEIAQIIVEPGKWDNEKKCYEELHAIITDKVTELDLDETQLLNAKYQEKLKRGIDRKKVILIAREELKIWKAKKDAEALAKAA